MSDIAITAQQRAQVQTLLRQRLPHVTAMAYGSRVVGWSAGNALKPHSDLDIALFGLRAEDGIALANLRADLEESNLPWRVDLTDANDLPEAMRERVQIAGISV